MSIYLYTVRYSAAQNQYLHSTELSWRENFFHLHKHLFIFIFLPSLHLFCILLHFFLKAEVVEKRGSSLMSLRKAFANIFLTPFTAAVLNLLLYVNWFVHLLGNFFCRAHLMLLLVLLLKRVLSCMCAHKKNNIFTS